MIAVLAGNKHQFDRFLLDIEPEDRHQFYYVYDNYHRGIEPVAVIKVGTYWERPMWREMEEYLKLHIR